MSTPSHRPQLHGYQACYWFNPINTMTKFNRVLSIVCICLSLSPCIYINKIPFSFFTAPEVGGYLFFLGSLLFFSLCWSLLFSPFSLLTFFFLFLFSVSSRFRERLVVVGGQILKNFCCPPPHLSLNLLDSFLPLSII